MIPTLTPRVRLLLLALAGAVAWVVLASGPGPPPAPPKGGDLFMYEQMVARLSAGEPYYTVIGDELRKGQYYTREIFHWRTPFVMSTLAVLPISLAGSLAIVLAAALCLATFHVAARFGSVIGWTAALLQVGAVARVLAPTSVFLAETWSGLFIGISICASLLERHLLAAAFGGLALFARELAAPYCVVAGTFAVVRRRWSEVWAWGAVAALYSVYFFRHLTQVWAHQRPEDTAGGSWIALGGLPFVLSTVQAHVLVLVQPSISTAIAFVLVLAGVLSARTPALVRAVAGGYLLLFLVCGKPYNNYWGLMAWPAWAFAGGHGLELILYDVARWRQIRSDSPATP